MTNLHRMASKAAQWVVDKAMGSSLAQEETEATGTPEVFPGMPELARRTAAEGCVLLKNDGTLPLSPEGSVAVFGRCQLDWFFMGHGSGGDVHPPYTVNLMEGLSARNAIYDHVLAEIYQSWCATEENRAEPGWWGHWPTHYPEMPVNDNLARAASHNAQTAIVVLGRCAGESQDLKLKRGGYYLTNEERALIDTVTSAFEHTVIVLNTGNVIDLSWVESYGSRIGAVLLAWQGGMESGNAVADVLYGVVNPCGRLTSTFATSYNAYPSTNFGGKRKVEYSEGIFVGYRHFDSFAPAEVLYPFGYGLSYTSFGIEPLGLELHEQYAVARLRVTNTGPRAGREVVKLWCHPTKENLSKPERVLAGFGKTGEIAPYHREELQIVCDLKSIAFFDETTSSFVLDAGTYRFEANGTEMAGLVIPQKRILERCQPICVTSADRRALMLEHMPHELPATTWLNATLTDVANGNLTLDEFVAQLSNDELQALMCGEGFMNSELGTPGNAGAFGGVSPELQQRAVPPIICADGPSGARLRRYCSLLPCATNLACTWDTELVRKLYTLAGSEVAQNGVDVLLAPGMNIQRNPLCGRNFEYFSEDPLLTGCMGAAVVQGIQDAGVSACPKHFACNNQELRRNTCDSRVSVRTLREVYLRGFEICVRTAKPDLIMTSYNKINGIWAHYHFDLVTLVLRGEWGFDGVVITDWWMRPARCPEFPALRNNAYRLRAGVDVLMPGTPKGARGISRGELQRTARAVLSLALKRMQIKNGS